jgi:hypothetical protein
MLAVLTIAAENAGGWLTYAEKFREDKSRQEGEGLEDCHVYDTWDFFL